MTKGEFKLEGIRKTISSWISIVPKKISGVPATRVVQWLLFILLALLTTVFVSLRVGKLPKVVEVGEIAPYDIRADRDYTITDEEATERNRAEALKDAKKVYTFDPLLGIGIAEDVKTAFSEMKRLLKTFFSPKESGRRRHTFGDLSEEQFSELKKAWESLVGVEIAENEWKFLIDDDFSDEVRSKIMTAVINIMSYPIVESRSQMVEDEGKGIVVRIISRAGGEQAEEEEWDAKKIAAVHTVKDMREDVIKGKYVPDDFRIDQYDDRIAINIAAKLIRPNTFFDDQETKNKRSNLIKDIKSVVINIKRGESIVRGGSVYTARDKKILESIKREKAERSLPLEMIGSFAIICTIYLVVYLFGRRYVRRFAPTRIDLVFMGSLMLVMLLMLRFGMYIIQTVLEYTALDIPTTALTYAIPLAAGAMLVRFIINSETAALFAVVLAAFTGVVMEGNVYFPSFTLISSFTAAVAISRADKRSAIFQAGVMTGFINAVVVLSIHLINAASVIEPLNFTSIIWYTLSAFANGVGCSVFVLVMAPISESVFGYTTDIKLLELANMNNPLLRELLIRAPGTFNHSHLVGILAEAAAEEIGANPLLARVGALYHDIGKIKKPQYFTENISEGGSIHDSLSPHMSALIISSHVKEGIELARSNKLPDIIVSMIPEHHGTKQISFFYKKAKESTDPALQRIEEKDFKYPGPKPQSREAAILMLADGAEAAVRSIKEKTPTRIQQVVEGMIDKSFTDGQLSECDLTLKDLNRIAKAFTRVLGGIYHQRVEYPKEVFDKDEREISVFEEGKAGESGGHETSWEGED